MIYIGNNYLSQLLAPPICRIPKWGKRDGYVVVVAVLNLKYDFDEGIEGRLVVGLEVGTDVVGQFVDAGTGGTGSSFEEILDTTVGVGSSFFDEAPRVVVVHARQTDENSGSWLTQMNVENVAGELVGLFLCNGGCRKQNGQDGGGK